MLTFYGANTRHPVHIDPQAPSLPRHISWIDALEPTPEETARLTQLIGASIPTIEDLLEIESSSRLATEGDALVMSLPAMVKDQRGYPKATPIGLVVKPERTVTIRFDPLPSFDQLSRQICAKGELPDGGVPTAITLIEIIIDQIADTLERIGGELDGMSRKMLADKLVDGGSSQPRRANRAIAEALQDVGRIGDLASKVSETLLGLSRMAPFIAAKAAPAVTPELKGRLDTISADARSLHEYQEHLSNKTQFMLDLLLGLANIEQNNVFRVLTVVSVIGIPPTFVASMYGMNFKNMPELEWTHGYAWGLSLIAISAIAPALWFKIKGWW